MAVEMGPNFGSGSGGSSGTQTDYSDSEVGAYPYTDTISGSSIPIHTSREDILAAGERRSRNYYIATLGIIALLLLRG